MERNRNRDLTLSVREPNPETVKKAKLNIDEDSFDIIYDIHQYEQCKYLYIKAIENTAVAPFIYIRSYEIKELCNLNSIFRAVDLEEAIDHLEELFKNNRVYLYYRDNKMIIKFDAIIFYSPCAFEFELYKEIPKNGKDEKLMELYNINKNTLKKAIKLFNSLKSEQDNKYKEILKILMENFDINQEPLSTATQEGNNFDEEKMKKIFQKTKKENIKILKNEYGFKGYLLSVKFRNKTDKIWPVNYIQLKIDEIKSTILCERLIDPVEETKVKRHIEFLFYLGEKVNPGNYKFYLDVFVNKKKLEGIQTEIDFTIE